ncbi:prepilin-type N-terminal cleavage/methylation domain-containing protein [Candidatus Weimeria sp. HCP3S3_B5]|uniref:prepilin-type N-terminal cleavage/methylation domain-containing protein n=1 Tax=Candidatus Weimeria sp. HCP3S3_B5 TaxID=3438871 RepID=UPI003F8C0CF1
MNTKVAKKNNKGFTLIELIVVIAIIAVLAAILAPQYLRYVEKSRVSADKSTENELINVVKTACADEDLYSKLSTKKTDILEWSSSGITVKASDFTNEIKANFSSADLAKGPKSNTYKEQTLTVSAEVDATTKAVSVTGSWSGGNQAGGNQGGGN